MFQATGWESSFRREVLSEARVCAVPWLFWQELTVRNSSPAQAVQRAHFVLWAVLPPPLSFPGSAQAAASQPPP